MHKKSFCLFAFTSAVSLAINPGNKPFRKHPQYFLDDFGNGSRYKMGLPFRLGFRVSNRGK